LESENGKTYKSSKDNVISVDAIKQRLRTHVIGSSITYFDKAGSTNGEAKKIAEKETADGSVIIAGEQTSGRGRLGRRWFSPRGGVWISVVLRPPSNRPPQKITLLSGLSIAQTLRELFKIDAVLKWPNDVLVRNRKISGVLTEGSFMGDRLLFVLVGIGINANISLDTFPIELRNESTSLKALLRRNVSLDRLICRVLTMMEHNYDLFVKGQDDRLWLEYEKLCATIGSEVRVESGKGEVNEGLATGISREGGLIIKTKNGSELTILSGDCFHLRASR
jgi:BirA family biotin operon repressor/biotin-[acetyl-CoA-carboxylase] ligase